MRKVVIANSLTPEDIKSAVLDRIYDDDKATLRAIYDEIRGRGHSSFDRAPVQTELSKLCSQKIISRIFDEDEPTYVLYKNRAD